MFDVGGVELGACWKLDIQAIVEYKMFDVGGVELGGGVGTSSRGWR